MDWSGRVLAVFDHSLFKTTASAVNTDHMRIKKYFVVTFVKCFVRYPILAIGFLHEVFCLGVPYIQRFVISSHPYGFDGFE